jgi:large subunit ribosomal protein L24
MPVQLTDVRLIYALTDPETGIKRDVIVKELVNTPIWKDRHLGITRWSRIIPGLNIKVPWPHKAPKKRVDYPNDTLRMELEVKTFMPTLLRPPMPGSVIDELRNKYSKFRTRHDPEYIEAKIKEDMEAQEKKKMIKEMWTPLKEANRLERKLRRAKGKGKLTRKLLTRIGEVIARKRQLLVAPSQPSTLESLTAEA